MKNRHISLILSLYFVLPFGTAMAQKRMHIHMTELGANWRFPVVVDSIVDLRTNASNKELQINLRPDIQIPFQLSRIDSLTVADEPLLEGKDPYQVFQMYITTNDGSDITSKEYYKPCHLMINAHDQYANFSANARIRGRGNSSFEWYSKKPFRIKLDKKHKMYGVGKAKSWVLLANYRDVTDMMNTFVFEMGRWMGLPYTNHTRYVELFLNGEYWGVYQLTEQIQQGTNRVDIDDLGGILISLDADDGPDLSPSAKDNFWSEVYSLPVCVKYPDEEDFTSHTVDSVKAVFAELEQAIKSKNYHDIDSLFDVSSFIKYMQIQEFIYNVEVDAPRSIFLHRNRDDKWVMGPLWDFDAGYDFDWGDMYKGHGFFSNYKETVLGSNPYKLNGNYKPNRFFADLFGCKEFVEAYKAHWASVKDEIVSRNWDECMKYVANLRKGAISREANRWPLSDSHSRTFDFETELEKMHQWLLNRANYMTTLIENIPTPSDPVTNEKLCGTLTVKTTMQWSGGYSQSDKVAVNKSKVLTLMGVPESEFNETDVTIVPLMSDGSEGENNTNGVFGGWFDGDGNPGRYANGHVYIEVFEDLWNWNCGLYQSNCWDNSHTVVMQYQYPYKGTLLKVNIKVKFTINTGW